ncbi:DUF1328 domain-containing protein [Aestuariibacter halophilus]|uniref:UPF0391 membrane protein LJ739_15205 n=1 Tax=Fluctibacter halophilus TaxID=226011 RepID=A0ABS8GAL0_9ALTE|nr:DUF1328 domain-containing protein [Aestuariibacter halophilus]MCC2617600.1 DUF1328 domain-containing protein [Aestuariibacter halophilus]
MLGWAIVFFFIAVIAGVLGFAAVSAAAVGIAKVLFYLFVAFWVISVLTNALLGRSSKTLSLKRRI